MTVENELAAIGQANDSMTTAIAALHLRRNELIVDAHAEGMPITEIAEFARVSRPTVYAVLRLRLTTEGNEQLALFGESATTSAASDVARVSRWLRAGRGAYPRGSAA
jgi:transposase